MSVNSDVGRDGLAVPPPDLLFLVAGTTDVPWFLDSGKLAFESIRECLRRCGVPPDELRNVLDFGCGCGRVIRYWRRANQVRLFGTDYNSKLITWCKSNLPFATFSLNDFSPPLNYSDHEFDFVYALSVFTHLSERLQFAWMDELRRVIRPGGYLLITTHGNAYLDQLSLAEREEYQNNKLVVRHVESAGSNHCGAFHPELYVRRELTAGFTLLDFIPEGAKGNPRQDLYLLKKK